MRQTPIKPRNRVVRDGGLARRSGAHGRTRKAQRRVDKMALKRGDRN